jgi:pimeloyl-ACP methyl ester carboxylesterase
LVKLALITLVCGIAVLYLGLVALLASNQRRLIYFPGRPLGSEEKMARIAVPLGLEPWRDAEGLRIGWRQVDPAAGPAPRRMVDFHGNAGSAFERSQYLLGFGRMDQGRTWQVFLFEYPGYDVRPGEPGEESFVAAGRKALEQLVAEDSRPIFLTGESLGGGLACRLAGMVPQQVAGLFLMTPFASMAEVGSHHYPWLPVNLVLRDRWDNVAALRNYHGPVAIMVAGQDEVVTSAQSHKLYESYSGPKRQWVDPDATHNTVSNAPAEAWWREVSDFLIEHAVPRP